jgi:hypothetical protein
MSVKEALQDVVGRMQQRGKEVGVIIHPDELEGYARELSLVLKCMPEETLPSFVNPIPTFGPGLLPAHTSSLPFDPVQMASDAARREEAKRMTRSAETIESYEGSMIEVVGGPADGTFVHFDPNAPMEAKTVVMGQVYVKRRAPSGVVLEHDEEETKKLRSGRA